MLLLEFKKEQRLGPISTSAEECLFHCSVVPYHDLLLSVMLLECHQNSCKEVDSYVHLKTANVTAMLTSNKHGHFYTV